MNKLLTAFLSVGGVFAVGLVFFILRWGFFRGLALGALLWIISAIIQKARS